MGSSVRVDPGAFDEDQLPAVAASYASRMSLTSFQRSQLVRLIRRRREALLAELREDAIAPPVTDADDFDAARDWGELRALDAALKRLEQGRYGICIDCAVDIPYARLEAAPEALRCAPCQERHEKTFATNPRETI